ncbi:MAG: endolytic transglycosylase MltG [Clostridiales bacterium]|nr:endolytic transglycosylase MltG [Clostridiales bacterium]
MLSKKIKIALRILLVTVLLFIFLVTGVYFGYNYVISQEQRIASLQARIESGEFVVDKDTEGAVPLVINTGDMTSDIAEHLFELGLIDNTFVFSLMSKINGFDGAYMAGTHYLMPGMAYDEIMYFLTLKPESVVVTFPEGITYNEIKQRLHDAGLTFSDEEMDECMDSPNLFTEYRFVAELHLTDERDHVLSGYLFPDTYEFDINASARTIVNTFLNNTNSKLYDEYYDRADAIGMSLDEVITFASLIQSETSRATDMMFISAVFHNRLASEDESFHYMSSDASINYLREMRGLPRRLVLTSDDLAIDSPYNTYTHPGLPPGPVCMPGLDAIQAALYPEPNCNYFYFCADGEGGTVYAVTLEEHEANVARFREIWEAQDAEAGVAAPASETVAETDPESQSED